MQRLLIGIVVVLFSALLSGCVGNLVIGEKRFEDNVEEHGICLHPDKIEANRYCRPEIHYSKADVLIKWGEPDSVDVYDDKPGYEEWSYHREVAFSGLMPVFVIPVPLLVPVGYRDTVLGFQENRLVSVIKEDGGVVGGVRCFKFIAILVVPGECVLED